MIRGLYKNTVTPVILWGDGDKNDTGKFFFTDLIPLIYHPSILPINYGV